MNTEVGTRDVVQKIFEYIRAERLRVGDRLPSIRDMSGMWVMGRNVVRDGLMQAQSIGLIKIHPRSGAFVQSLDFSSLVDALTDTVELALVQDDVNVVHLNEARRVIETEVACMAAKQRCPDDIIILYEALRFLGESAGDRAAFIEADEKFHLTIARISRNPALEGILKSLLVLLRPFRIGIVPTEDSRRATDLTHKRICRSIEDGDVESVKELMTEHLTSYRQHMLENAKSASDIFDEESHSKVG